jgi:hypothetical protein
VEAKFVLCWLRQLLLLLLLLLQHLFTYSCHVTY